jgi:hypothetical protein
MVLGVIALLLAVALPSLGRMREVSGTDVSLTNLVNLSVAHALYAADWDGRQFTTSRDDFGAVANSLPEYMGSPSNYYQIPVGWSQGFLWVFTPSSCPSCFEPMRFTGPAEGFGSYRIYNFTTAFHDYVNGRTYDPVFFAPNDTAPYEFVEEGFEDPDELVLINDLPIAFSPSYGLSPAAMFSPQVMRAPSAGGWQDPWSLDDGFASPPLNGALYPDLKTHMIERHWAQNPPAECNPAFPDGTYDGCEPYYFNHGIDSAPAALFYDGHTRLLPNTEVLAGDQQVLNQTGGVDGLWSRDTPFGANGYFIDLGYDGVPLSHHILTTDGILGRDTLGPLLSTPPMARKAWLTADTPRSVVAPDPPTVWLERGKP